MKRKKKIRPGERPNQGIPASCGPPASWGGFIFVTGTSAESQQGIPETSGGGVKRIDVAIRTKLWHSEQTAVFERLAEKLCLSERGL